MGEESESPRTKQLLKVIPAEARAAAAANMLAENDYALQPVHLSIPVSFIPSFLHLAFINKHPRAHVICYSLISLSWTLFQSKSSCVAER